MKLRIKGNSLRLRLEKPEVNLLGKQQEVFETTEFLDKTLYYGVKTTGEKQISVHFLGDALMVYIPKKDLDIFCNTEKVGITANFDKLTILIEKDFQCLHKRPDEDESNMFENPLSKSI